MHTIRRSEWHSYHPSRPALDLFAARFAVGFRVGGTVIAVVTAALRGTGGISFAWLAAVLAILVVWSVLFTMLSLSAGVVLCDSLMITGLLLAHSHIVTASAVADGTTWVLVLASTAVFIPQLMLSPWVGLPVAGVVTAAYVYGAPEPTDASFLVLQALVTSLLMYLLRQGGRAADRVIAEELERVREVSVETARMSDEVEQYNCLHDTVLSTLTMAVSTRRSTSLAIQAEKDLRTLRELAAGPEVVESVERASLLARLKAIVAVSPLRAVEVHGTDAGVPPLVAVRIAECVAEALRNTYRHAGTAKATIRVTAPGTGAEVEIRDEGRGFDPAQVGPGSRGIRSSIIARMSAVGGAAEVVSIPGGGTSVWVRWPGE
jgi:two-component sensor histidine kinase